MNPGDIVRHRGHRGALYRVQSVEGDTCNVFGGPRRQARALPLSELEPASKRDAETFERVRAAELAALRRIPAGRAIR